MLIAQISKIKLSKNRGFDYLKPEMLSNQYEY